MKRNNIKSLILGLFVAGLAFGIAAATQKANKEEVTKKETIKEVNKGKANLVCFVFKTTIDEPTAGEARNPANYTESPIVCPGEAATLCSICFDKDQFPLNPDGSPNLDNTLLGQMIIDNMDTLPIAGSSKTITDPGTLKWVTLHYRELQ